MSFVDDKPVAVDPARGSTRGISVGCLRGHNAHKLTARMPATRDQPRTLSDPGYRTRDVNPSFS